MFRGAWARAGVIAFVVACVVPFTAPSDSHDAHSISVAPASATATHDPTDEAPVRAREIARAEVVLGVQSTPVPSDEPLTTPDPTAEPPRVATPTPAPAVATLPPLPDPPTGGIVIASWYGPGFYGNKTACGQVYTPEIIGVAHRTLRCGTMLVLEYRGRTMTVPVIDRGPYIAGRTLDLSNATRLAMACPDLCTLSMRIAP
jgi:Lytic transglycolase